MTARVTATVRACFMALRQIRSVKNSLTHDALLTLIRALVVSKLDYCSSVFASLPGSLMRLLNSAARLVYSARRSERVTPLLRELHWLRVPERIQFRLCVLTYRCLHGSASSYLAETLHLTSDMESRRRLRSGSTSSLMVPSSRRATLGDRAFPVAAARAWNSLPTSVSSLSSYLTFRRKPMSQLQTQQLMTSQIRSHVEYLVQTYNILVLKIDEKCSRTDGF